MTASTLPPPPPFGVLASLPPREQQGFRPPPSRRHRFPLSPRPHTIPSISAPALAPPWVNPNSLKYRNAKVDVGDEAIVEHQRRFRREPGGGLHRRHGGDQAVAEARGGEGQAQEQGPHPGGFAGGEPRMNRSIGNFASTTFLAPSMIIICCFSKLDARGSGSRLPAGGGGAHPSGVLHARAVAAACLPAWAAAGQPAC